MTVARHRRRKQQITQRSTSISEQIGRYSVSAYQPSRYMALKTVDDTIPDYQFWDEFRNGRIAGYRLSSLLARRIEHIFAGWTLGRGVTISLAEAGNPDAENDPRNYTDELLVDFLNRNHSLLLSTEQDKLGLGDQYIIVNMDGSLSIPSPDTVTVERDPLDYRAVTAYVVTTKLDEYEITDRYTLDGRTVIIKKGVQVVSVQQYQNLIGRIPVIHLANEMSGNEVYGRSIHFRLLAFYDKYDDVIYKQIDGARLLGNPMLAFTGLKNVTGVQNANAPATTSTYYDTDGNLVDEQQLNVNVNSVFLLGEGGDAKMVAPPTGFTADTQQALKTLFMLGMYEACGIPEFIWGNELSGAHATTDVQMTQWVRDIEARQKQDEVWLLELCEIWLLTVAITDPQIVIDKLQAEWPALVNDDEKNRLEYVRYAHDSGLLTAKTALEILDMVDDPAKETEEAQAEFKAKQEAMFPDAAAGNAPVQQMFDDEPVVSQPHDNNASLMLIDAVRELRAALLEVA